MVLVMLMCVAIAVGAVDVLRMGDYSRLNFWLGRFWRRFVNAREQPCRKLQRPRLGCWSSD